jgi:hypothetical protein
MGCGFSDKTKGCCAKFVMGVSVLLFILSVVLIGIGGKFFADQDLPTTAEEVQGFNYTSFNPEWIVPVLGVVFGALTLVTSCCGCMTSYCKKPCFAFPYFILAFVLSILLYVAAAALGSASFYADTIKDQACNSPW